jgi:hypothetical protein
MHFFTVFFYELLYSPLIRFFMICPYEMLHGNRL